MIDWDVIQTCVMRTIVTVSSLPCKSQSGLQIPPPGYSKQGRK